MRQRMRLTARWRTGGCAGVLLIALAIAGCGRGTQPPAPQGRQTTGVQVATLASYHVSSRQFSLVSFDGQSGTRCITVDQAGRPGVPACGIELNAVHQVNAAILNMGGGITAVYGRAASAVRQLLEVDATGHTASVGIYLDKKSGERYFAVFITARQKIRFAVVTPSGQQLLSDLNDKLAAFLS
jgi:hypothetical protein